MTRPLSWANRRVFVTGATGLVGSWLVKDLLDKGAAVVALVRDQDPQSELFRSGDSQKVNVVNGALEDLAALERAINDYEAEIVFHLGAQAIVSAAHRSPLAALESNVRGTYNLLEACRRNPSVRAVVVASSDKAYGAHQQLPYTEDMDLRGGQIYEVSKSAADLIAQAYNRSYGTPVAIARCGNTYGGGDLNWDRLVPGTIRALLEGKRPLIRSDGTYVRDYIYVRDVAAAYIRLAEELPRKDIAGQAFNFGNEKPLNVLEIVDAISGLCNARHLKPDIRDVATGEIRAQYLSSAKARLALGWRPEFDLTAGLTETIAWYRGFLNC